MKIRKKIYNLLILILFGAALFISCGGKRLGYGYLLWSSDEDLLETGTLVPVLEESNLRDTYTLELPGKKGILEVPRWRVEIFRNYKEAEAYAEKVEPYKTLYAIAERNALPLRKNPNQNSERVYKMRKAEIIKVINREGEKSQEGIYEGYWYLVLTEDGTRGYCFDQYFTLFEGGETEEIANITKSSEEEELFFSRSYKPRQIATMIASKRVDISRIFPSHGLFPDQENMIVKIVAPHGSYEFSYTDILIPSPGRIVFTDTGLNITLLPRDVIQADYSVEGNSYSEQYVYLDRDINEILEEERKRRDLSYEELRLPGSVLQSNAYGVLSFEENRIFSWEGYERLIPAIIPRRLGFTGKVQFPYFLGDALAGKYTGVITLVFDTQPDLLISFLYQQVSEGLRLIYVPQSQIVEGIVDKDTASPFILFFTYSQ